MPDHEKTSRFVSLCPGRNTFTALLLSSLACSLVLAVGGCNKEPAETVAATTSVPTEFAAGKAVFDANNCVRCHTLAGNGGRMGPELTHIGAAPGKSSAGFATYVKDPKAQNPRSRMPAFSQLSQKQLDDLGTYLASLK